MQTVSTLASLKYAPKTEQSQLLHLNKFPLNSMEIELQNVVGENDMSRKSLPFSFPTSHRAHPEKQKLRAEAQRNPVVKGFLQSIRLTQ